MKYKALAALGALALISACNKAEDKAAADAPADAAAAPADAAAAASTGSTGVAECDDYLAKVQTCVNDKIPEAQRAMVNQSMDATKKSWASVTDKTQLAAACKSAMDQAKASYGAMGCTF